MKRISRRQFIERSAFTAAGLATAATLPSLGAASATRVATDRIELGKTGISASRIAMGTGFNGWRRSSNQTRLGRDGFVRLMRHGFDNGLNFYDMADLYGSHSYMKEVLKDVPRDDVVLLSKIWFAGGDGMGDATERAVPSVERFRKELDVEHIDVCLIHCVTDARWTDQLARMRDELSEYKEKGVIRATGVSCHDFDALKVAASEPWVDLIFARINNRAKVMDHEDPNAVAELLKTARSNGKAVVGMKIFGAGQLAERHQRDESLRYVWGNDLIDAMTIGFEHAEQVDDTIGHLNSVLKG